MLGRAANGKFRRTKKVRDAAVRKQKLSGFVMLPKRPVAVQEKD
jgi:hypothetical protein